MSASVASDTSPAAARVEELARGIYAYVQPDGGWWINNSGFVAAGGHAVLVDTCATERRTRRLLDAVQATVGTPVRTVVNTHHHGDHTNGNYLADDAVVIGHAQCRKQMLSTGINKYEGAFVGNEWGELELRPPDVTFTDTLTVYAGDTRIELHHVGTPAHTTNDVVVWLPEQSVLFSGDVLFNGGTPFALMGSVAGSRAALDLVRGFGALTIVPGHGQVCGPELIDQVDMYFAFVQRTASAAREAGLSPLEAARAADLGEFAALTDRERFVANLHRAYAELDGKPLGVALDLRQIIGDMIVFNGGAPIRCYA